MENEFYPSPSMALAGIVMIPIVLWFIRRKKTFRLFLFGLLVLITFASGTLEILGVSQTTSRLASQGVILLIAALSLLNGQSSRVRLPGILWLIGFIMVALASFLAYEIEPSLLALFYRDYLFVIVLVYAALNIEWTKQESRTLVKLLAFFFLAQIGANIIKIMVIGEVMENYIGTMSNVNGSLTMIVALLGSAVCISLCIHQKSPKYLVLLLGFILFAVLGNKRAVIVYTPLLYIAILVFYQARSGLRLTEWLKQLTVILLISSCLVYVGVRAMPSLNPERVVWGTFDIGYAFDYGKRYVTTQAGTSAEVGRARAPLYVFDMMISDSTKNLLLGYGAGHLVQSRFNPEVARTGDHTDLTTRLYGVGYGARTGFLQLLLQVGMLGLICYVGLWVSICRSCWRAQRRNPAQEDRKLAGAIMFGMFVTFTVDFFTYSEVMLRVTGGSVAFCIAIVLLRQAGVVRESFAGPEIPAWSSQQANRRFG